MQLADQKLVMWGSECRTVLKNTVAGKRESWMLFTEENPENRQSEKSEMDLNLRLFQVMSKAKSHVIASPTHFFLGSFKCVTGYFRTVLSGWWQVALQRKSTGPHQCKDGRNVGSDTNILFKTRAYNFSCVHN